ncbi:hypothetical protein A7981_10175 [Methylovorus sp. MM2]|uniref:hypothetical protein n=1 Tax=Methylovorus sp. MM2 TaxID=1848038 RepID=UPI0007DFFA7A|nr:hypothetical protein [Methylovorus sp. MM2]OAM51819.1 hypothetical protein A7981_10175 [Methylovorus sp. MM2]
MEFARVSSTGFLIIIFATLTITGCAANTGIVKISDDTYMIGKQGGWESSGSVVKVELYKEGNQFCSNIGKKFVPLSSQSDDQGLGKHATAEIQFKCQ